MKLVKVKLKNFRCFGDEVEIPIDDLTALIGKNDSGKSSVFEALAIFFEEQSMDPEDASVYGDKRDVRITCIFEDLPEELILDVNYPTTLEDEHLLNDRGQLEIVQCYDASFKTPKLTVSLSAEHPTAKGVNDLMRLMNPELKERLKERSVGTNGIDTRINAQMRQAIWREAGDLQLKPTLVRIDDAEIRGAKKVWGRLKEYLPSFSLFKSDRPSTDQDAEAQNPMKAAVKEALKELEPTLDGITKRVVEEVLSVARSTVEKLREMDPRLAQTLEPKVIPKKWDSLFKVSLSGDDDIPMNKRGSGVRRLILLNFFRAKAERERKQANAPSVIYAIEEPETCQHPNWQKMLVRALTELSEEPDCQVMLSTHTPMLASLIPTKSLRYVEIQSDNSRLIRSGDEDTYALVANALGVLPDNRVKIFVAVEGINDISFLESISAILRKEDPRLPDLHEMSEREELIFIPLGGANLKVWTSRLSPLRRPEFHLYDRDVPPKTREQQAAAEAVKERDMCEAELTGKREMENYLHPKAIEDALGVRVSCGDIDNVPELVARELHQQSDSHTSWDGLSKDKKGRKMSSAKKRLNREAVGNMTPALLKEQDPSGDVKEWLTRIAELAHPAATP